MGQTLDQRTFGRLHLQRVDGRAHKIFHIAVFRRVEWVFVTNAHTDGVRVMPLAVREVFGNDKPAAGPLDLVDDFLSLLRGVRLAINVEIRLSFGKRAEADKAVGFKRAEGFDGGLHGDLIYLMAAQNDRKSIRLVR